MQYFGEFSSKEDICREFAIDDFDGVVLYAEYACEDYEGSAHVLFMDDAKFYYSEGSHCSCYGLEGQWSPEDTTIETLLHMARKGTGFWSKNSSFAETLGDIVERGLADLNKPDEVAMMLRLML